MNIRKDYGVPVLLPGKSHGWRSLDACSPWGCWGLDSNFTFTFHFHALEKEMATRSSVLAWRIPGMGEPGGLPSMGLHRVGHNWRDSSSSSSMGFLPERLLPAEGLDRTVATRSNLSNVLPGGSDGKESICNVGDLGSIPGLGRSLEEGMVTLSSILAQRIPKDRRAWWATVYGITKSWIWLSD